MAEKRTSLEREVRDVLTRLYDVPYLQSHKLTRLVRNRPGVRPDRLGTALRDRLLQAIDELRPGPGQRADERAGQRYDLMRLRYVEAMEVPEICSKLGLSQSQFYRVHDPGFKAVVASLAVEDQQEAAATSSVPNNLPIPPTALVGREKELDAVRKLLLRDDVRLVTLTGTGGVGKTRLALEVARGVRERFPDGVFFVSLAPMTDASLVATTIADALGLQEFTNVTAADALHAFLAEKQLLLVLDNFEHVLPGSAVVVDILGGCAGLKVLATSRARLRVRGEHQFGVPPLTIPELGNLPAADSMSQYGAIALFDQRARAVDPEFRLSQQNANTVAEICARVDGLPLAIELSAARIKLLPPKALLARLETRLPVLGGGPRDAPQRHQTLRATLEWSYTLLDEPEQRLFRRLAGFTGGVPLAGVESVCGSLGDGLEAILNGLSALVDNSLLQQRHVAEDEPRFFMLETIREYALEQLRESGEESKLREGHLRYFSQLAEAARPELRGAKQIVWLELLEREHDNFRAALDYSLSSGCGELGIRLVGALSGFWSARGHLTEGRSWLIRFLSLPGPERTTSDYARALFGAGLLAASQGERSEAKRLFEQSLPIYAEAGDRGAIADVLIAMGRVPVLEGDYPEAARLLEEGLAIRRDLGDPGSVAEALSGLADLARLQGEYHRARSMLQESLVIRRDLKDEQGVAASLSDLALVTIAQGNHQEARSLWEECLKIRRAIGDQKGIAATLADLGRVAQWEGEDELAELWQTESLALRRELGDKNGVAFSLNNLGELARRQGRYQDARYFYEEGLRIRRSLGLKGAIATVAHNLAYIELAQGELVKARDLFRETLEWGLQIGNKRFIALGFAGLGAVFSSAADRERGVRCLGLAHCLLDAIGGRLSPADQVEFDHQCATAREDLGGAVFERLWREAWAIPPDDIHAYAAELMELS